jgi:PAS domain-containing protein
MSSQPLTMARRHVLGDLYSRCEPALSVPVYLNDSAGELLGYVDESHGKYADAFTFHLADDVCKKLATGHFTYSFDYEFADGGDPPTASAKRRIRLNSIMLIMRKGYDKPVSRSVNAAKAEPSEAASS